MTTIETLVSEQLWQAIQLLLPAPPPRYGGRPRVDDRAALAGIVYQLRAGIPWRLLPVRQFGCGSPVTCWRRLRDWQRAGVWQQLHQVLLDQLGRDGQLDWSRASLDSSAANPACWQHSSSRCARALTRPSSTPKVTLVGPPVCTITPGSALPAKMKAAPPSTCFKSGASS
jgi:transposase